MAAFDKLVPSNERRRHQRVRSARGVALLYRGTWHDCTIIDVSPGGAAIASEQRPPIDREVIFHIVDLGLFKCRVLRHTEEGFAVRFEAADFDMQEVWRGRSSDLAQTGADAS